jgi:CpeT/CpcT family (DUF1001)
MTARNLLAEYLIGEFDNTEQSKEDPTWYVPLRLWHRLLPFQIQGKWAIFAEQANILSLELPYRQRILVLEPQVNGALAVQYWAFKNPTQFRSAGANPDLLDRPLEPELELLPGCWLNVLQVGEQFKAEPRLGDRCCFDYNGKQRQVVLGFEASQTRFLSYDRGVDPETGQSLWGALMGPYQHQKRVAYPLFTPVE